MSRSIRLILFAWVLAVAGASTATASGQSAPAPAVDVDRLGPKVGEAVPDFRLTDQNGVTRTLASILGPKGALLVLYRSADW